MAVTERIVINQDRTCSLNLAARTDRGEFLRRINYVRFDQPEDKPVVRLEVGLEHAPIHWPNFEEPSVRDLVAFGREARVEAKRLEGDASKQEQVRLLREAEDTVVRMLAQALMELKPDLLTGVNYSVSDEAAIRTGMVKDKDF